MHYKDEILDRLAERGNVAQFVSFGPNIEQRFARIHGFAANHVFPNYQDAIQAVFQASSESSVNVRSFDPASPKSREFVYGLRSVREAEAAACRLAAEGLHTIVNETIDVCDGGVSGVALGDALEFAPCDTPRCVEKPGTAAFSRSLGLTFLECVYGFQPNLSYGPETRVEFSLHPLRRGFRQEHTIIWELENVGATDTQAQMRWPNRFSQYIGDKAFGLLVAHLLGLPVPETVVISRAVGPFHFGQSTGSAETWLRTCPRVQVPGKYTTHRGWMDPFKLMSAEDPTGESISSILAQAGVDATYSGAAIASEGKDGSPGEITIEGTPGFGDEFMVGRKKRTRLPKEIVSRVEELYRKAFNELGPVRFEWVSDLSQTWIVQFHRGASPSAGNVVFPGNPQAFRRFNVEDGLEKLRSLVEEVDGTQEGIVLVGDVGVTSHFGDVLRRAMVPSYIDLALENGDTKPVSLGAMPESTQ